MDRSGTSSDELVLEHHGVKGQKWGVRRDRGHEGETASPRQIAKSDKQYAKSLSGIKGWVKVQNTFAKHINPELEKLNENPKYKNKPLLGEKNAKLYESYLKEYDKLVDVATKATTEELGMNASGTRQIVVTRSGSGETAFWKAEFTDPSAAQHDGMSPVGFTITPKFDSLGHIVSFTVTANSAAQGEMFVSDFLAHHGVKGMKWGVKRALGKIEAGHAERKANKVAVSEDHEKAQAAQAKIKKSGVKSLTNEELQSLVNRKNLEAQHLRLTEGEQTSISKGHNYVQSVIKTGKTVNEVIKLTQSPAGKLATAEIKKQLKKAKGL